MRTPATLWLYLASWVVGVAIGAVEQDLLDYPIALVTAALIAALLVLLLRGSRMVWSLFLVLEVAASVTVPFDAAPDFATARPVAGLTLLLWPSTRRFVRARQAE